MAWREHINQTQLASVNRTPAVRVSTKIQSPGMTSTGQWRQHAAVAHIHAHLIANHVGSLLASHLTSDPGHAAAVAKGISRLMFKA